MTNLPNKVDGDIMLAADVFKVIGYVIPESAGTATAETVVGSLFIAANSVTSGIIATTNFTSYIDGTPGETVGYNFRIRVGSDTDPTNETEIAVRSQILNGEVDDLYLPGQMSAFYSGADWTQNQYVHVTASRTGSTTILVTSGTCHNIMAFGV